MSAKDLFNILCRKLFYLDNYFPDIISTKQTNKSFRHVLKAFNNLFADNNFTLKTINIKNLIRSLFKTKSKRNVLRKYFELSLHNNMVTWVAMFYIISGYHFQYATFISLIIKIQKRKKSHTVLHSMPAHGLESEF